MVGWGRGRECIWRGTEAVGETGRFTRKNCPHLKSGSSHIRKYVNIQLLLTKSKYLTTLRRRTTLSWNSGLAICFRWAMSFLVYQNPPLDSIVLYPTTLSSFYYLQRPEDSIRSLSLPIIELVFFVQRYSERRQ